MLCFCLVPAPSWYPLCAFQTPNPHTWVPISSSFLCCYPSNSIPLFFKWLFLCRFPFLLLPGLSSAHSHLFKRSPSIPPHNFFTVTAGILLGMTFMGRLILLQIGNACYLSVPNPLPLLSAASLHLRLNLDCMPANWHLQLELSNRKPETGTWSVFRLALQKKDRFAFLMKRRCITATLCTWKITLRNTEAYLALYK